MVNKMVTWKHFFFVVLFVDRETWAICTGGYLLVLHDISLCVSIVSWSLCCCIAKEKVEQIALADPGFVQGGPEFFPEILRTYWSEVGRVQSDERI